MQTRGYTLVEVTVVIGIVSILLALAVPRFGDYLKRSRSETQTRLIFMELQRARANALYQRRETRIKFFAERFEVYSSATDGSAVAPILTQALSYPIIVNSQVSVDGDNVDFDQRGLALNSRSICIDGSEETGTVDSVVVSDTRVTVGKKNIDRKDGKWDCKSPNITVR